MSLESNFMKFRHKYSLSMLRFTWCLGQGCHPDPVKAASIFTDLSMKAHPYAQVGIHI